MVRNIERYVRRAFWIIAVIIFVFSACRLIDYFHGMISASVYNEELAEEIVKIPQGNMEQSEEKQIEQKKEISPIAIDFETLFEENDDIVGWLYSVDTPINYPVVQAADNEYYVKRNLNGERNSSGTLFMDYRNVSSNMDWNTVIYGHNMKNDTMFGSIPLYSSQEYYDLHPVVYFLTPETDYKIELLSGFVTSSDSSLYNIYLSKSERKAIIEMILDSSDFLSQAEYTAGERLLTLSTCSYEYDAARYVVIGKMIEVGKAK